MAKPFRSVTRIEGCTIFGKAGSIAMHLDGEYSVVNNTVFNAELAPWSVWRVIRRHMILTCRALGKEKEWLMLP